MKLPASFIDAGPQGADIWFLSRLKNPPETFCFIFPSAVPLLPIYCPVSFLVSVFFKISGKEGFSHQKTDFVLSEA